MKDICKLAGWATVLLFTGVILALCGILSTVIHALVKILCRAHKLLSKYSNGLYFRAMATIEELKEKEAA